MFKSIIKKRIRQFGHSLERVSGTRAERIFYGSLLAGWFAARIGKDALLEVRVVLARRRRVSEDRQRQASVLRQALKCRRIWPPRRLFAGPRTRFFPGFLRGGSSLLGTQPQEARVVGGKITASGFVVRQLATVAAIKHGAQAKARRQAYCRRTWAVKTVTDLAAVGFAVKAVPEYRCWWAIFGERVYHLARATYLVSKLTSARVVLGASLAFKGVVLAVRERLFSYRLAALDYRFAVLGGFQRFLAYVRQWLVALAVWAGDFVQYGGVIFVRFFSFLRLWFQRSLEQAVRSACGFASAFDAAACHLARRLIFLGPAIAAEAADTSARLFRSANRLIRTGAVQTGFLSKKLGGMCLRMMHRVRRNVIFGLGLRLTLQYAKAVNFVAFLRQLLRRQIVATVESVKLAALNTGQWLKTQSQLRCVQVVEAVVSLCIAYATHAERFKIKLHKTKSHSFDYGAAICRQIKFKTRGFYDVVSFRAETAVLSLDITATRVKKESEIAFFIFSALSRDYARRVCHKAKFAFVRLIEALRLPAVAAVETLAATADIFRPHRPQGRWAYSNAGVWFKHQRQKIISDHNVRLAANINRIGSYVPLRRGFASVGIFLMLLTQSAPVVAETMIITDADVNLKGPVLKQEAAVISNLDNLIQEVNKRMEDLTLLSPVASNQSVESEQPDELASAETSDLSLSASSSPVSAVVDDVNGSETASADATTVTDSLAGTPPDAAGGTAPGTIATTTLLSTDSIVSTDGVASVGQSAAQCNPSSNQDEEQPAGSASSGSGFLPDLGQTSTNSLIASTTPASTASSSALTLQTVNGPGSDDASAADNLVSLGENAGCEPTGLENAPTEPTGLESAPTGNQTITDGDGNQLDTENKDRKLVEIINTNTIKVVNEVKGQGITGINAIQAGNSGRDARIDTGDINVFANVLNVVNTNLLNSKIVEIAENFNSLSADVLLNHPETTPAELAQDLVTQICGTGLACKTLNSFTLTNQNTAEVENDVDVFGQSGQNLLENIEKRGTIRSGNVNALVNILNIVNTNLINSRWTIASINIFGDFQGDVVLPSELYFAEMMSIGASDNAQVDLEQIEKVLISVQNDNEVDVVNNVNIASDSGQNSIEATGAPDGKKGELNNGAIGTGESRGESNVRNVVNTNVFNGKWYLGMVNTLGDWAGQVFSLPSEVAMGALPTGLTFFASSAKDNDLTYKLFEETVAKIDQEYETTIQIHNQNRAKITNNVDLGAFSGENSIRAQEVEEAGIFSGNTYALANILNFANTNLINADLHVGLVNVFGKWNGNIVFGFPDLTVEQQLNQNAFPAEKKSAANFKLVYENKGDASMMGTVLEWQYDPSVVMVLGADKLFEQSRVGSVAFNLGKVGPRAKGEIALKVKTLRDISAGEPVSFYARISGIGAERKKDNNESVFHADAQDTQGAFAIPDSPAPPAGNSGAGGGDDNNDRDADKPDADKGNSNTNPNATPADFDGPSQVTDGTNAGSSDNLSRTDNPQTNNPQNNGAENNNVPANHQNTQNSIPSAPSPLRVILDSDIFGKVLKPGDKANFTLTAGNAGQTQLYNIVLYNQIRGPDNRVVLAKQIPVNKLQPEEGVEITYELEVTGSTPAGVYTNSAYAEAVDFQFRKVRSNTAVNTFTVRDLRNRQILVADLNDQGIDQDTDAAEQDELTLPEIRVPDVVTPDAESESLLDREPSQSSPLVMSKIKGVRRDASGDNPLQFTPSAALKTAREAEAGVFDEIVIPALQKETRGQSPWDQFITIVSVCFLIALGYAVSNLRQRMKEKAQKS